MENNNEKIENKQEEAPEKKTSLLNDIIEIIESTLVTVFVIVMVFTYILHPVNIVGHSMVPTLNKDYDPSLNNTDKIFMSTVFFDVDYGDILVINKDVNYLLDENGEPYIPDERTSSAIGECIIKRVIAKGGQTVDIREGKVIVDDKVLNEPYINSGAETTDIGYGAFTDQYPITIPDGYYFVMGDNRNHSTDSRARSVGLVKKNQIYGKALVRYSPLKDFDILTDSWKGPEND
ncbi:signal peptidase I [Ruminococcus sp. YRD2003]|uniref:signal peptidase I n=1 Tax=Ruminococcus sp. YRD2003 TaxID=1452313 RepID=UPI0008C8DF39|nr:signal peptidase I [Ruminococcus flavefaciens]